MIRNILIILNVVIANNVIAQDEFVKNDLKIHTIDISSNNISDLAFLDSIVDNYSVFAQAEYHRSNPVELQTKKMITYLHKQRGLNKIVLERPYCYGYWVNEFLKSGDTILLKTITDKYRQFDYMPWGIKKDSTKYVDSYGIWKWLYNFNKTHNCNIQVNAVDIESDGILDIWTTKELIDRHNASKQYPNSYTMLTNLVVQTSINKSELKKINKLINLDVLENEKQIKVSLAGDFIHFMKNLQCIQDFIDDHNTQKIRESVMIRNFKRDIKPTEVVYLQFGHGHILRTSGKRFHYIKDGTFMERLGETKEYGEKILSFYTIWKGYRSGSGLGDGSGIFTDDEYYKLFNSLNPGSYIADFRKAKNSYADLTKYFQFCLFLKK